MWRCEWIIDNGQLIIDKDKRILNAGKIKSVDGKWVNDESGEFTLSIFIYQLTNSVM